MLKEFHDAIDNLIPATGMSKAKAETDDQSILHQMRTNTFILEDLREQKLLEKPLEQLLEESENVEPENCN